MASAAGTLTAAGLAADLSACLALGVLLAGVLLAGRAALGGSKAACFVVDVAGFALAAVLLCGFAASRSAAGAVRWYMLPALAAGAWAGWLTLGPTVLYAARLARWAAALPFALLADRAVCPAVGRLGGLIRGQWRKIRAQSRKRRKKRLQKNAGLLYNSN